MNRPLEFLLARQWASLLETPVLLFGACGELAFYNEPAERLMGRSYDATGPLSVEAWTAFLAVEDADGRAVPLRDSPLLACLNGDAPGQADVALVLPDGGCCRVRLTVVPLRGPGGRAAMVLAHVLDAP